VIEFSNDELMAVYSCVYDEVYYGDDDVVYGDDDYAVALRKGLAKIEAESKRQQLW